MLAYACSRVLGDLNSPCRFKRGTHSCGIRGVGNHSVTVISLLERKMLQVTDKKGKCMYKLTGQTIGSECADCFRAQ